MTKKIYALLVLLFCVTFTFAQNSSDVPSYEGSTSLQDEEKSDLSENYFPPKPKHGTEIGLNLGYNMIHGDVYTRPGFGIGLHVRRAINYTISWRLQAAYGQAYGLDDRPTDFNWNNAGGLQVPASVIAPYTNAAGNPQLYRNYKTENIWFSGHIVANVSNILFHKKSNKWNIYAFAGPSLYYYNGSVNIFDGDGVYTTEGSPGFELSPESGDDSPFFQDKISGIRDYMDDSYETEVIYFDARTANSGSGENVPGLRRQLNLLRSSKANIMPALDVGIGVARKFGERFNVAIEHQFAASVNDNLDGYTPSGNSSIGSDIPHFTNIKLNFNLNPKDGVEPLYWVNPLAPSMEDMARLKRDKVTLKDSDGDGVLDEFDEEPDTPEDYPVDTRGRTLDSDGDGVADPDDAEPYTPYNLISDVDEDGKAPAPKAPEPGMTRDEILSLAGSQGWDKKCDGCEGTTGTVVQSGCSDWFLPMIHFDLNKYNLKPESKASLHHIAQVMKQCPEICVVAVGHTDRLNNNDYNMTLSYNRAKTAVDYLVQVYGISPSRLKVNYGGEETPLIDTNGSSYINRRVEFRVCNGEMDMGAPGGSTIDTGSSSGGGFQSTGTAPVKY